MNISLVANAEKTEAVESAKKIEKFLKDRGISVSLFCDKYEKNDFKSSDCIIAIGGDGTILRLSGILSDLQIPILGINEGHLGYLTEASADDIERAVTRLIEGDYIVEKRTMLHGSVRREGRLLYRGTSLNEIIITRGGDPEIKPIKNSVSCNGKRLVSYRSDGIIFSTPTGSTAYNLSAGGPVVSPDAPVMVMLPICPHSIGARPVVLNDRCILEISAESHNQRLAFDGDRVYPLQKGDLITIKKAWEKAQIIKLKGESFLETLREKMVD